MSDAEMFGRALAEYDEAQRYARAMQRRWQWALCVIVGAVAFVAGLLVGSVL